MCVHPDTHRNTCISAQSPAQHSGMPISAPYLAMLQATLAQGKAEHTVRATLTPQGLSRSYTFQDFQAKEGRIPVTVC